MHVAASCIMLGEVLTQAREGELNHPIAFVSMTLSKDENNYSRQNMKAWQWCMCS